MQIQLWANENDGLTLRYNLVGLIGADGLQPYAFLRHQLENCDVAGIVSLQPARAESGAEELRDLPKVLVQEFHAHRHLPNDNEQRDLRDVRALPA